MSEAKTKRKLKIQSIFSTYGIYIVFVVMVVLLAILTEGRFITPRNISIVLRQIAINGIIAVGMCFVIITGGIDLSVGAVLAFAGAITADLSHPEQGLPLIVPIIVALAIGAVFGFANGSIISFMGAPAFVVTMGMMNIARGATYLYTNGAPIKNLSDALIQMGQGTWFGVPVPPYLLAIFMILGYILLQRSKFGRDLYALGGNEDAALASGVNVNRTRILAYAISGMCAAFCGLVLTGRTGAAAALAGEGYELNAIAAVVVGGTSLSGGKGTMVGTLIGALIIGALSNGLDILGVSSYIQTVVKGVIIIAAVCLDSRANMKKN